MHGRLKIKTTAQQEAERQAERRKKVQHYQVAMNTIFEKRNQGQLDSEMLKITGNVLMGNPDITTLWNIRKETLLLILPDKETEDKKKCLTKELELTQQCLVTQPKSYGAWYHRCWCLLKMPDPNWSQEIKLCNKYISLDERNFHCWDYRRFITAEAKVSPMEELEYSMQCINVNFSNYSAWHYRSKLLPLCYPGQNSLELSESKRREEIDLIQNAAFTDPDDSSAWFYHTWLLNTSDNPVDILGVQISDKQLLVAFSNPINYKLIKILIDDNLMGDVTWTSAKPGEEFSKLWICPFPDLSEGQAIQVCIENNSMSITIQPEMSKIFVKEAQSPRYLDEETRTVLEQDLQNCQDLLDLEPDSKWTRLSMILVMQTLDEKKYFLNIQSSLDHLKVVDPKRISFYQHLKDEFTSKNQVDELKDDPEAFWNKLIHKL